MKFEARIDRFVKDNSIKAIASVVLDGMFVVKNLRVVNGANGCFVAMPQESYKDKQGNIKYRDVFFPMTPNARAALESAVISAFDIAMFEHPPDWAVEHDTMLPMEL